jgi:hypothetical protein
MLVQLGVNHTVEFHHDGFEFNDGARPPLDFSIERRLMQYRPEDKIVYLTRDPRDLMVSLYHQITGRFRDFFGYEGMLTDFIRDTYFGAENLARFRCMWRYLARERDVLEISYEECHRDSRSLLARVVDHYGFIVEGAQLDAAVAAASFDRMKAVEREGSFDQPWLRLRNGAPKIREGKIGGHRNVLSPEDIAFLDATFVDS